MFAIIATLLLYPFFSFTSLPTGGDSLTSTNSNKDIQELLSNIANCAPDPNFIDNAKAFFAPPSGQITWTTMAPQPYRNSEGQGMVVNGKLYVFGGFDIEKSCCTPTDRAWSFDPVTNHWAALADMPPMNGTGHGGVTHAGFATDDTDIYFAGGYTSSNNGNSQIFATKEAWKYNVSSNSYTRLPDLPTDRSCGQLEYLNGKLHFIGGSNKARTIDVDDHYVLDLNNLNAGWSILAPLPNPRHHAGSVILDGKIYYVGGQHGHDGQLVTQSDLHRYDPQTNNWVKLANMPRGRGHISSSTFVLDGQIFVIGGEIAHGAHVSDVTVYNPGADAWETWTPLPESRSSGVSDAIDGVIYFSSGSYKRTTYKGVIGPAPDPDAVVGFTLIDAVTEQPIPAFDPIPNGAVINLAELPNQQINIEAHTNPTSVASVVMQLTGPVNRTQKESTAPYTLFGDEGVGAYNNWSPPLGSYSLTGKPFSQAGGNGEGGTSLTINFSIVNNGGGGQPPTANAGNNQTLTDTDGNGSENVTLNGSGSSDPGGSITSYVWKEGSTQIATGVNPTVNLTVGTHNISLTVTDNDNQTATAQVTIIVNPQPQGNQLVKFTLIDAVTEQPIPAYDPIPNGAVINLAELPNQQFNIEAHTNPAIVGSVVMQLSGALNRNQPENMAPYTLFGDDGVGAYNNWSPALGSYTLKGTPYTQRAGGGQAGTPLTVNFSFVNNPVGNQLVKFTLIDAVTEQPIPAYDPIPNGAVINLAELPNQQFNIEAHTDPAIVGSVVMQLSGALNRTQSENMAPYTLFGDDGVGAYNNWSPALGSYTLKGTPYTQRLGGGQAGSAKTISFSIVNQTTSQVARYSSADNAPTRKITGSEYFIEAYPNPIHNELFIRNEGKLTGKLDISLTDPLGRTLYQKSQLQLTNGKTSIDLTDIGLESSIIFLTVKDENGKEFRIRLLKQ